MLLELGNTGLDQDEHNPNTLQKIKPVVIKNKEKVLNFFTEYGHLSTGEIIKGGNNTKEYGSILLEISQLISKICTDIGLENFKKLVNENPEQTKELLRKISLGNKKFVDFSKPLQDGLAINLYNAKYYNIVTSVQIVVPFILQNSNEQEVRFVQNYCLGICRDMDGSINWIDFENGLYRYKEINNYMMSLIEVGDRTNLYNAYYSLFNEKFPISNQ